MFLLTFPLKNLKWCLNNILSRGPFSFIAKVITAPVLTAIIQTPFSIINKVPIKSF